MSTRCQVQVTQENIDWDEQVTLYHHTDGYPDNIIPLLKRAYKLARGWQAGRAGKVASFLCAVDPGIFEPEAGHALHGDIEYLYRLFAVNTSNGSLGESPQWEVEILTPQDGFWKKAKMENMKVILKRTNLAEIDPDDIKEDT